tara:strand:- start:218 stop:388 length:171 start_codon:yes stop_codon:yes gene_type:complete
MKQFLWCRKLLSNGEYYYIYVVKEAAIEIYQKKGFEINIDSSKIPEKIRKQNGNLY